MILLADWTSMALNLLRIEADGTISARRDRSKDGAASVPSSEFSTRLEKLAGDWLTGCEAIYVTGMATARGNWLDTGYIAAPAGLADFRDAALEVGRIAGCDVFLLPGLSVVGTLPDVMRGEEIKVFGLTGDAPRLAILPGKHSKWVTRFGGEITNFATYLSGEIGALLARDSILSKLIPVGSQSSDAGFKAGLGAFVELRSKQAGVLRAAFSARSAVLLGDLQPSDIVGYLDGLIVAAELEEAQAEFLAGVEQVALIGSPALCERYAAALESIGVASTQFDGHALAARSVAEIHRLR